MCSFTSCRLTWQRPTVSGTRSFCRLIARVPIFFGHDFDAGGSYFARPEFGQNILFAKVETSVCCDVWHGRRSQNATLGKVVAVFYRSSLLVLLSGVDSSNDQNSFVWTQGSFFTHWHGNLLWSHLIPC